MKLDNTLDMVMFCCLALMSIASGHIQGSLFYALTIEVGTGMCVGSHCTVVLPICPEEVRESHGVSSAFVHFMWLVSCINKPH